MIDKINSGNVGHVFEPEQPGPQKGLHNQRKVTIDQTAQKKHHPDGVVPPMTGLCSGKVRCSKVRERVAFFEKKAEAAMAARQKAPVAAEKTKSKKSVKVDTKSVAHPSIDQSGKALPAKKVAVSETGIRNLLKSYGIILIPGISHGFLRFRLKQTLRKLGLSREEINGLLGSHKDPNSRIKPGEITEQHLQNLENYLRNGPIPKKQLEVFTSALMKLAQNPHPSPKETYWNSKQFNAVAQWLLNNPKVDFAKLLTPEQKQLLAENLKTISNYENSPLKGLNTVALQKLLNPMCDEYPSLKPLCENLAQMDVFTFTGELKVLGGGAVNTVYSFKDENGKALVFKPISYGSDKALSRLLKQITGTAELSGIDVFDLNIFRSIEVDNVAKAFFAKCPERNTFVNTRLACVNGQFGIVMDMASGKPPKIAQEENISIDRDQYPEIFTAFSTGVVSKKQKEKFMRQLQCRDLIPIYDKNGQLLDVQKKVAVFGDKVTLSREEYPDIYAAYEKGTVSLEQKTKFLNQLEAHDLVPEYNTKGALLTIHKVVKSDINFDHPKLKEDLILMQTLGIVMGDADRHPNNLVISQGENGIPRLFLIDNDVSFGKLSLHTRNHNLVEDVRRRQDHIYVGGIPLPRDLIPNKLSLLRRLPPVITKDIQDLFNNFTEQDLRKAMRCSTEEEIQATCERLEFVKNQLNDPTKTKVVETAAELNNPEYREEWHPNNDYLSMMLRAHQPQHKGWNHLRRYAEYD